MGLFLLFCVALLIGTVIMESLEQSIWWFGGFIAIIGGLITVSALVVYPLVQGWMTDNGGLFGAGVVFALVGLLAWSDKRKLY